MSSKIRVRFAPSPTGHLHIGGARTALFNFLFARHHHGTYILRVEDTDRERSTQGFVDSILEGLKWLGLEWDEGPFHQIDRFEIYKKYVDKLLQEDKAYRCYCSAEELETKRQAMLKAGKKPKYDGKCRETKGKPQEKSFCVRFKAPLTGAVVFHDICRGEISVQREELDDLIIARTDSTPTYNFTVVVDDVEMQITHVIRGDDHLNNTPRQIQLYEALNFPIPKFAHLPMIHGADKKKLSKRHGAVSVLEYRDLGFLPEAMINYLARLGWSSGDQEIFTCEELVEKFDIDHVGKSPSIFDIEKCEWVNAQHLKKLGDTELTEKALPFLEKLGLKISDKKYARLALTSEREKSRTLQQLAANCAFYFHDSVAIDPKAQEQWLKPDAKNHLSALQEKLKAISDWNTASLEQIFQSTLQERGIKKMVELAQPCRVALTGTTVSPGIFEVMAILGKDRVLKRLNIILAPESHKSK